MWVLSTDHAELRFFGSPESVPGGYAILSHVWGEYEQSFQDIQEIRGRSQGTNPRDFVSDKIRECCILAECHGYRWLWVDTCCINKTSSAELSEALNSMFRFYALAAICYVYLRDVPSHDDLHDDRSAFRRSRWHTRSWTLQELLAPRFVVFVSQDWEILGGKADLASLLKDITRIPRAVLTMEAGLSLFSVAQRMSWAAGREATRQEDEAYSLLGIFEVSMTPVYGEGGRAFQRLQEEIMKHSTDLSLFAWGLVLSLARLQAVDRQHRFDDYGHHHGPDSYLFASSPWDFRYSSDIYGTLANDERVSRFHKALVDGCTFSITPRSVLARVPLIEQFGLTIAVFGFSQEGNRLGLLLTPCPDSSDPSHTIYDVGITTSESLSSCRLIGLGGLNMPLQLFGEPAFATWREVHLAHRPSSATKHDGLTPRVCIGLALNSPFRFHHDLVERWRLLSISDHDVLWDGYPSITLTFTFWRDSNLKLSLQIGRCNVQSTERAEQLGHHWARITFMDDASSAPLEPGASSSDRPNHACLEDHISKWLDSTRKFTSSSSCVTLHAVPCPVNPSHTFILDMNPSSIHD